MTTSKSKNLFILAGNGPYQNKGCEAIVRGTTRIIRRYFDDPSFLVCSFFSSVDQYNRQVYLEKDPSISHVRAYYLRQPALGLARHIFNSLYAIFPNYRFQTIYRSVLKQIPDSQAVLSVGGDNYSLDYGDPKYFTDLDDCVLSRKGRIVIWGASIGPFSSDPQIEKQMARHLGKVTAIYARESRTMQYLEALGIKSNVTSVVDPAFAMPPEVPLDQARYEGLERSIGLNFSPLMARYVTGRSVDAWREMAFGMVKSVKKKFRTKIYLIPHDVGHESDYVFLKQIEEMAGDPDIRVTNKEHTASEVKWLISKLLLFCGARTHSTIAAISSGIPTLTLSYSSKSIGLNQDVYGHLNFCINPRELSEQVFLNRLEQLWSERNSVRNFLARRSNELIEASFLSGARLKELCQQK